MSSITIERTLKISCIRLPLAIYREIASHLKQIEGVKVNLLPQTSTDFDYLQSQVGGLLIQYPSHKTLEDQVKSILAYYETKYGTWISE